MTVEVDAPKPPLAVPDPKPPSPGTKGWKKAWRILRRVMLWSLGLGLFGAVAAVLSIYFVVAHYEAGLPSVEQLQKDYRPPQVTRILAKDGAVLAEVFKERRTVVSFASIPGHAKLAFLAAEDARFYEHEGLNYLGMLRAMWVNLRAGRTVQGGSTITQQVVKNVLLVSERTYARKIQETILARRLEQTLPKDAILGLYLNHIYLGHGRYGIEEASRLYFGKHVAELGLAESALLAGIVASPERFSPRRDSVKALERRRFVLLQMGQKGFVSPEAVEQALKQPLHLALHPEDESDLAPEAVALAKQMLERLVGEEARRGGYTVHTTIDTNLQAMARQAVRDNLIEYGKRYRLEAPLSAKSGGIWGPVATNVPRRHHAAVGRVLATDDAAGTLEVQIANLVGSLKLPRSGFLNSKNLSPSKYAPIGAKIRVVLEGDPTSPKPELRLDTLPQSALVALDVRSRRILAIVGSREALNGGLDRATQMRRQPGSSFKPFVYSYALASRKFTPASLFTVPPPKGQTEPLTMTMRDGLARSENAVAQQLLEAVGAPNVVSWAKQLGIESPLAPTASLALGAYEVSPLEITNAYATLASGGVLASPVLVTRITGPDGREIAIPREKEPRNVISPDEAYLITSLMRSVVEKGTAQRAKRLGRPVVGKTGTTNQAKDTWFVGYSPEVATGVWVGYDDPIGLGDSETGGGTALPAWVSFMKAALAGLPIVNFPRPTGIEVARIDPVTGLLALDDQENALDEDFLAGTAPQDRVSPDAGAPAVAADAGTAGGVTPEPTAPAPGETAPLTRPAEPTEATPVEPKDPDESGSGRVEPAEPTEPPGPGN